VPSYTPLIFTIPSVVAFLPSTPERLPARYTACRNCFSSLTYRDASSPFFFSFIFFVPRYNLFGQSPCMTPSDARPNSQGRSPFLRDWFADPPHRPADAPFASRSMPPIKVFHSFCRSVSPEIKFMQFISFVAPLPCEVTSSMQRHGHVFC